MKLGNTPAAFGILTRLIHWLSAGLVLLALALGTWLANAELSLASLKYFAVHKTIGVTVFALILIRMIWHRITPPPAPLDHGVKWQDTLARIVHRLFYLCLVAMPLTGWFASSASGIDSLVFGLWTLPSIAPESETLEDLGFMVHAVIGRLLMLLIIFHVAGVVYRTVKLKDRTLRRMTLG